jgi:hypothetical protein
MRTLAIVRRLAPELRHHARAVLALVGLGTLAAFSEGLGIGLFIPLLRNVQGLEHAPAMGSHLGALLERPLAGLGSAERVTVILACLAGKDRPGR